MQIRLGYLGARYISSNLEKIGYGLDGFIIDGKLTEKSIILYYSDPVTEKTVRFPDGAIFPCWRFVEIPIKLDSDMVKLAEYFDKLRTLLELNREDTGGFPIGYEKVCRAFADFIIMKSLDKELLKSGLWDIAISCCYFFSEPEKNKKIFEILKLTEELSDCFKLNIDIEKLKALVILHII